MAKPKLEPLALLDLSSCHTVSEIVDGMAQCSFGARMLGEAAATLTEWCQLFPRPTIIYDGPVNTGLHTCLCEMVVYGWCKTILTSTQAIQNRVASIPRALVVGPFMQRHAEKLYGKIGQAIYINREEQCPPNLICDGHYPSVVFADPDFIVPVLECTILERLHGSRVSVTKLFDILECVRAPYRSSIADGAATLAAMVEDPDCTVFLTISGAMTVAQMGWVICDMIDTDMVQYIASTGALMAHGLVQSVGLKHYKHNPAVNDTVLARQSLNRITDTLEPETNLDHVADVVHTVLANISGRRHVSSHEINRLIGRYLAQHYPHDRGILKSAYEKNVPVVVPAFIDSELGNDVYTSNLIRQCAGKRRLVLDMEKDSKLLVDMATSAKRLGIFTIGGGVPRNNTQNVAPLIEIINARTWTELPMKQFTYGCRICPDAPHFGHLSGCTYSEGESWRKFKANGRRAEIRADATQVWPFLVRYILDLQNR